jgi:hypothetical protein
MNSAPRKRGAGEHGLASEGEASVSQAPASWNGRVHPVAECFPLLQGEDADELAEDIKASGLSHELVLDSEGTLIDGRNRLEACNRVGVEPRFTNLPSGADIASYIMSANIRRRHLSAGQKAMLTVKVRKVCDKPLTTAEAAKEADTSQSRMKFAAVVLDHGDDDLIEQVINGDISLDQAYRVAKTPRPARDDKSHPVSPASSEGSLLEGALEAHAQLAEYYWQPDDDPDDEMSSWQAKVTTEILLPGKPEDLNDESSWKTKVLAEILLPFAWFDLACTTWTDEDLTRHPAKWTDVDVRTMRRVLRDLPRVVQLLCPEALESPEQA